MAQLTDKAKQALLLAAAGVLHLNEAFDVVNEAAEAGADSHVKLAGVAGAGGAGVGPAGVGAGAGAGETIAQQAAAAGKAGISAGHSPPKKVATPKGAAHFHVPLGALIIPHTHFVHGQPSHWIHGVSQAKWVANQWKDIDKGGEKAEAAKAVESGSHKWVQAGKQTVAVHHSVEVHVPKDTDIHDPGAVKNVTKVLVHHGDKHEHVTLHPDVGLGKPQETSEAGKANLAEYYKKLPDEKPKKAVHINGQHAAWVPHDWQVHKAKGIAEPGLQGKFAKDPEGKWHLIDKSGTITDAPMAESHALHGHIIPEEEPHEVHPDHVVPNQGADGTEQAKVDIGGVAATKDQIQDALKILQEAKSTNVKGPLKAKGNPLWEMDYMGVSEAELKAHPNLNVSSGTKKQHVGKVKGAVMHHLAAQLDLLAKTEAEQVAQKHVTAKAEAEADHAQLLTPAAKEWGGKTATAEQLAQAAKWLQETMGGKQSFKQAMTKLGNPLAGADYMAAAKAYAEAHPNTAKGWSTKKLMLESILELQGQAEKQDAETGHTDAAALHDALAGGMPKGGWDASADGAVAAALVQAAGIGTPVYAFLSGHTPGLWVIKENWPPNTGKAYMEATPDHHVIVHTTGGAAHEYDAAHIADIVHEWVKPKAEEQPTEKAKAGFHLAPGDKVHFIPPEGQETKQYEHPPLKEPSFDDILATLAASPKWQAEPEWQDIHDLVSAAVTEDVPTITGASTDDWLARSLWIAHNVGVTKYLVAKENGQWASVSVLPIPGTWAAQTVAGFYRITKDHQIVHTDVQGNQTPFSAEQVLELAQKLAKKAAPEPEKPAEPGIQVVVGGHPKGVTVPAGSKFYKNLKAVTAPGKAALYVKKPDGTWAWYGEKGIIAGNWDHQVGSELTEVPVEEAQGKVKVSWGGGGGKVFWADPGTTMWYDATQPSPAESTATYIYLKKPDSTWQVADYKNAELTTSANSNETLNAGIGAGEMKPYGEAAVQAAKALAPNTPDVKPAQEPAPVPGEVAKDISVTVFGKVTAKVPAGSKVYWYSNVIEPGNPEAHASAKYVKKPDGTWVVVGEKGAGAGIASGYDSYVKDGSFTEAGSSTAAPVEPKPAEPEAPPAPSGEPVPVIYEGAVVGLAPAGSTVYVLNNGNQPYVKKADGKWMSVSSGGVSDAFSNYDKYIELGKAKVVLPPTEAALAKAEQVGKVKDLVKNGAVAHAVAGSSWQAQLAYQLTVKSPSYWYAALTIYQGPDGKFIQASPPAGKEHWKVSPKELTVQHVIPPGPGHENQVVEDVPFEDIKAAIEQHVQPNSVLLGSKVYKHGFYYNPKGKAYLEIKPGPGSYYAHDKADYAWHQVNGQVKEVTHAFAQAQLEKNTEYHDQPKPVEAVVPKKANYATPLKSGTYPLWSTTEPDGVSKDHIIVHDDGSGLYYNTKAGSETGVNPEAVDAFLKGGSLVDQYGTTVVKPGIAPEVYHLFGSGNKTKEQLTELRDNLQQTVYGWQSAFSEFLGHPVHSYPGKDLIKAWLNDKLPVSTSGDNQRAALVGLLNELLLIPEQPSGTELAGSVEPKFLKSLPPGIHTAKDVFSWNDAGYAAPFDGQLDASWYYNADSGQLSDKIKAVSAQFGNGQVVGTHLSGLTKTQKVTWLAAWQKGDMATVFALDAASGKVSPAHPGAPDNAATHKVTWAPWDPGQVPASTVIAGDWSPTDVQPTKAEVDNYLIKANLQHASYLTLAQRREWMKAHRLGDQAVVDQLSKQASDNFHAGAEALSEPPVWTDNIQPAKSYTVYLEDGTGANLWPQQALNDFVAEHKAEMLPLALQAAQETYNDSDADYILNHYPAKAVGKYLDVKAAQEQAEKLRPKYELVPQDAAGNSAPLATDQYGHLYLWHTGSAKELGRRTAVYSLARSLGIKAPRAELVKLEADGTPGVITDITQPTDGTLAHVPGGVGSLSERELADLAVQHVFDHVLGNPSSTPGEYVRVAGSLVGTGKDGAFTGYGWNGLDLAHLNDTTVQPVHALFQGIASGAVTKSEADQAYTAAARFAQRASKLSSSRLTAILTEAGVPASQHAAVFQRVENLPADVGSLWGQVYGKQGWALPELPASKLSHGLHSGFSEPEFFDHVLAAKASGVPAFFAGPHLEDASFLVWTEKAGDNRYLRGESGLRGKVLDAVIEWAQKHQTGGEPSPKDIWKPEPEEEPHGGVKGVAGWYAKIIGAAKAVSMHAADQNFEGNWTKAKLEGLTSLKTELTDLVGKAEEAKAKGEIAVLPKSMFEANYGPVDNVIAAAKYHLEKIDQVETAKQQGMTFKPGDIPEWVPPPKPVTPDKPEPDKPKTLPGLKVEYLKATRVLAKAQKTPNGAVTGDIVDGENELQLGSAIYEYPGYAWHITLPTGEVIEVNDKGATSSPLSHQGRVRFRAIAEDGSVSLERIRAQLQDMGVPLEEAAPEDMELFYWRHLANVLADRKDRQDGKHAQVWQTLDKEVPAAATVSGEQTKVSKVADAGLDPSSELDVWRKAWANLTSPEQVQEWVDKGGYLPHMPHLHTAGADTPAGKPYWYRFDADPAWLAKQQLPTHSLSDAANVPYFIATTGALYSTEARLRAEGVWIAGASSATDMKTHGSSGVVYTRRTQEDQSHHHVWISPRVLARTTTYGFNHDGWGDLGKRKTYSHFDLNQAQIHDTYETDVKDAISLLDDVMVMRVPSEAERSKVIKALKDRGITEIRGLPVEQRIVTTVTPDILAKAKAAEPDPSTWFDHPAEEWAPPSSGMKAGEHSVVESAAEKAASVAATPEDALVNALYSTDHSAGAEPAAVSQVFYHAPSKPGSALNDAPQVKHEVAQRIADSMKSTDEQLQALADGAGIAAPDSWGDTPRARTVAALIATWAQSNSSPIHLALQNMAHKLFKVQKDMLPALGYADASAEAAAKELESGYSAVLEDFLRTQWQETQNELANGSLQDLTLYRVFHFSDVPAWAKTVSAGDVIEAPQARPLSSWAFIQSAAESAGTFASGGKTVVVKATIPASAVLGFPRTGWGAYNEAEFVVLDMAGSWEVVKVSG